MFDLKPLCLLIVLNPLGAALVIGLFGKLIGRRASHWLAIIAVGVSCCLSLQALKQFMWDGAEAVNFVLYQWGNSGSYHFEIGFLIDRLSSWMMVVVSFVSWMVHIYTVGYMQVDSGYQRFFSYIALFTFGMLMLVMSNNFLQLFFGWEMVGLMSYLLIGFWFQKETAIVANLKAFIVNRVGDFGFILGIAAILYGFGTLDYRMVFDQVEGVVASNANLFFTGTTSTPLITFICLALFMGAMGKSAQIPLHVWLPDSMEGPTPISALIHAATMVTAGVFMLARLSPLFEYSETALTVVLIIGSLTCLLMGLVGIVQNDIKRVIAYSTLSQLGYMMTAMGVSAYPVGIFHLTTHAFFKALLFLGAGSVILALHHEQDIWKMGNLKKYMPVTYITMLVGSLALIGFPLFSGFYSKDLIIEAVGLSTLPAAQFAYPIVLGSVYITALYTFRLFFVVFHTQERMESKLISHLQESPAVIWVPLVLLAIPSFVAGGILLDPLFQNFFKNSIVIHANHSVFNILQAEHQGALQMALEGFKSSSFWLGMSGILTAWFCYVQSPAFAADMQRKFSLLYRILKDKFGFDTFNQWAIIAGVRGAGWFCWKVSDDWLIDGIGVNGTAKSINRISYMLRKIQSGYLYHYAFVMIVGFLALLVWLMLTE